MKTLKRLHGLMVTQTFPATKPAALPEDCDCQKRDPNKALPKEKKEIKKKEEKKKIPK